MIGYYKYPRKDIVKMIKSSPKTYDDLYYMKDFPLYNNKISNLIGERDTKYFYTREYFKNKVCFNEEEIDLYTATTEKKYDIKKMVKRDEKINETINELSEYNLYDKIDGADYNLAELIDTTIYIFNIKN